MKSTKCKPGDWVKYLDENDVEIISEVVRTDGTDEYAVFTKESGKYWLTSEDILECRPSAMEATP